MTENKKMRPHEWVIIALHLPFGVWLRSTCLAIAWRWFAVPLGQPAISGAEAYGLTLLASLFHTDVPNVDDKSALFLIIYSDFSVGYLMLAAWIVHRFWL